MIKILVTGITLPAESHHSRHDLLLCRMALSHVMGVIDNLLVESNELWNPELVCDLLLSLYQNACILWEKPEKRTEALSHSLKNHQEEFFPWVIRETIASNQFTLIEKIVGFPREFLHLLACSKHIEQSPIHFAVGEKGISYRLLKILCQAFPEYLENRPDIQHNPLDYAIIAKRTPAACFLINILNESNPEIVKAVAEHKELANWLLADIITSFDRAVAARSSNNKEAWKHLETNYMRAALILAETNEDLMSVRFIRYSTSFFTLSTEFARKVVHEAIRQDCKKVLEKVPDALFYQEDENGNTPLDTAIQNKKENIILLMIERLGLGFLRHISQKTYEDGMTILHLAIKYEFRQLISACIAKMEELLDGHLGEVEIIWNNLNRLDANWDMPAHSAAEDIKKLINGFSDKLDLKKRSIPTPESCCILL